MTDSSNELKIEDGWRSWVVGRAGAGATHSLFVESWRIEDSRRTRTVACDEWIRLRASEKKNQSRQSDLERLKGEG